MFSHVASTAVRVAGVLGTAGAGDGAGDEAGDDAVGEALLGVGPASVGRGVPSITTTIAPAIRTAATPSATISHRLPTRSV